MQEDYSKWPERVDQITLSEKMLSLANGMPKLARRAFVQEASGYANSVPSGLAMEIKEFAGPYDLNLDFDSKTQKLVLTFKGNDKLNAGKIAVHEINFKDFLGKIECDRKSLDERQVIYSNGNPYVIEAFEEKYKMRHAMNARSLMDDFKDADIFVEI